MIKDPPLLRIRRKFPRPSKKILAAFAGVPTGFVTDAMNGRGALDYRIKPLAPAKEVMVGVAMTCDCGPADNLALFGALATAEPGDVLLAATDGFTETSVTGDLLLGMAKNRGLKGIVTDGVARDVPGILAVGLPLYCIGVNPNSPVRNGPGTVGYPIVIGGVSVMPGDIVIGDGDGIVIVPRADVDSVLKRLEDVKKAEASMDAKVKGGLKIPDFVTKILESDRVVFED
jgi:4-hydroxy-4-methyl-2-oxoglutarate aldolase